MLNLQPPYLDVGNIRVYKDDKDASVFYYITQKPRLAIGDNGKPAISAYALIPESGAGKENDSILETALTLDVDLHITDEEMETVREAIKKEFNASAKTLCPAPLHKGVVRFMMAQASAESDPKKWYVSSDFRPSMLGTNRASLVVRTTGEDAKRLVATLSGNEIAALIYYDLDILGITPVFKARMKADMSLIYHHVQTKSSGRYLFYNKDIEKTVDELIGTKALTIEIEETDPDIKADAMKAMMNELKTEVTKRFFEEKQALIEEKSNKNPLVEGIVDLTQGIIGSVIPNKTYTKKECNQELLQTYDINLNQRNAKTIPVSPQGQIKEMIDSANIQLKDFLSWITLDALEVKGQKVTIKLSDDTFDGNFIKSVVTHCQVVDAETGLPVNDVETLAFNCGAEEKVLSKNFTYTRHRTMNYKYQYWSQIYLDSTPGFLPSMLKTKVCETNSNYITINPSDYYRSYDLVIMLDDLSVLEHTSMVIVKLDVKSPNYDNQIIMSKELIFDGKNSENKRVSIIADRELKLDYILQYTYVIPNAKDITLNAEKDSTHSSVIVPNPFENKWQVDIECMANWDVISKVFIETRVLDTIQEDPIVNQFTFNADKTEDTLKVSCSLDTPKNKFEYYYRVYNKDGSMAEGGWIPFNNEGFLYIDADSLKPERTIRFRLKNPDDFKKLSLRELKITFTPTTSTTPIEELILSGDEEASVSYPWKKGDSKIYSYKFVAKGKEYRYRSKKLNSSADEVLLEFVEE